MDELSQTLRDAGCGEQEAREVCALLERGQTQEALLALRRRRCALMDALHESQERVDCLDSLLRRVKKDLANGAAGPARTAKEAFSLPGGERKDDPIA